MLHSFCLTFIAGCNRRTNATTAFCTASSIYLYLAHAVHLNVWCQSYTRLTSVLCFILWAVHSSLPLQRGCSEASCTKSLAVVSKMEAGGITGELKVSLCTTLEFNKFMLWWFSKLCKKAICIRLNSDMVTIQETRCYFVRFKVNCKSLGKK